MKEMCLNKNPSICIICMLPSYVLRQSDVNTVCGELS